MRLIRRSRSHERTERIDFRSRSFGYLGKTCVRLDNCNNIYAVVLYDARRPL